MVFLRRGSGSRRRNPVKLRHEDPRQSSSAHLHEKGAQAPRLIADDRDGRPALVQGRHERVGLRAKAADRPLGQQPRREFTPGCPTTRTGDAAVSGKCAACRSSPPFTLPFTTTLPKNAISSTDRLIKPAARYPLPNGSRLCPKPCTLLPQPCLAETSCDWTDNCAIYQSSTNCAEPRQKTKTADFRWFVRLHRSWTFASFCHEPRTTF